LAAALLGAMLALNLAVDPLWYDRGKRNSGINTTQKTRTDDTSAHAQARVHPVAFIRKTNGRRRGFRGHRAIGAAGRSDRVTESTAAAVPLA